MRVEDARFQQLLVNYRNTVLKAAQEVEDALVGYVSSQQTLAFERAAVASAMRIGGAGHCGPIERAKWTSSASSTPSGRCIQQQNDLTEADSAIATQLIALYKALGGGWELRGNDPVVPDETRQQMKSEPTGGKMLAPRTMSKQPQ